MIKLHLKGGSFTINTRTDRGFNENPVAVLDINNINILYKNILPLFDSTDFLTKKKLDFADWSLIVYLNYFGYHLTATGKSFITKLKSQMNNFRLSTSKNRAKTLLILFFIFLKKMNLQ